MKPIEKCRVVDDTLLIIRQNELFYDVRRNDSSVTLFFSMKWPEEEIRANLHINQTFDLTLSPIFASSL